MATQENALTSEIVKISESVIDGQPTRTVNARELHAFLGLARDFTNWVKANIKRARLVENRDYVISYVDVGNKVGRPPMDYHLTVDACKHMSMLSNTEKGFEVRDYFIACEKELKAKAEVPTLSNPIMNMIVQQAIQYDLLERQQKELAAQIQTTTQLISSTSARVEQVAAIVGAQDPQYYSIKAYANVVGVRVDDKAAARLGRLATSMSNNSKIDVGSVKDAVWGRVNAYHESILGQVFETSSAK